MNQNRVFYELLNKVGSQGRYQKISLTILSILMMVAGASGFYNVYLFHDDLYSCQPNVENCRSFVCSLPSQQRYKYINSNKSLASKFGDFRCDGNIELDKIQSFIYLGAIFGMVISIIFSQLMTKRSLIMYSIVFGLIGIILTILAPTLLIASIGLFINFSTKTIQIQLISCFITQSVGERIRGHYLTVTYILYGVGIALNGFFFKIITSWQLALICYVVFPLAICLVGVLFYIQQTPFDLIINYTPEESLQALNRIGKKNGFLNYQITIQQIKNIRQEYLANKLQKHNYQINVLDLCRYQSLRAMVFFAILIQFFIGYYYNAPLLALKDFSLDIYLNNILIGFSQTIASIVCYFVINSYARKTLFNISGILSILVNVPVILFSSCSHSEKCQPKTQFIQTLALFLFRFTTTVGYNSFCMIILEAFPNQIRALALQTIFISSCIATMVIPQIISLLERNNISIIITFPISVALTMILCIKMPETFKIPPPEMIEELKYQHHSLKQNHTTQIKTY